MDIRKEGDKNFFFYTEFVKYSASDLILIFEGDYMKIRSKAGRIIGRRDGYLYSEVVIYDDTSTGNAETFPSVEALQQRLIDLQCPAYDYTSSTPTVSFPPVDKTYANKAALIADQAYQTADYIYEVVDASDFTGIDGGTLWVRYLGTFYGNENDYTWMDLGSNITKTSDIINDGSDGTSQYVEEDELNDVAFSGDYNDLSNKPTIPDIDISGTPEQDDVALWEDANTLKAIKGEEVPVNNTTNTNYSPTSNTVGGNFNGIDIALGNLKVPTAGIFTRINFTGDTETTSEGTFYLTNYLNQGNVLSVDQEVTNNDNSKSFFAQDFLSQSSLVSNTIKRGSYTAHFDVETENVVGNNQYQQRFTIEVYLADADGAVIDSGIVDAPTGDLGVRTITILDSGVMNLSYNSITNVALIGEVTEDIALPANRRIRYHISAEKIGTSGGNVDQQIWFGQNHNSYYDIPTPITFASIEGNVSDNTALQNALNDKEDKVNKGVANGYAPLDSNGLVPLSNLPDVTITDTFVVNSQASMLALNAQTGDVAIRTDENKSYILQGTNPSVLGDWKELLTPTDAVSSVNSLTGNIQLNLSLNNGELSITGGDTVDLNSQFLRSDETDTINGDLNINHDLKVYGDARIYGDLIALEFIGDGSQLTGIREEKISGTRQDRIGVSGTVNINWDRMKTVVIDTTNAITIADINLPQGNNTKVMEMLVKATGFTVPAYWEQMPSSDSFDPTVRNHIMVSCINGNSGNEIILYDIVNLNS